MALSIPNNFLEKTLKVGLGVWKGFRTMTTDPKKPRTLKIIGTHNGVFHCDEALACFMLKQLPEFYDAEIRRTRNPQELKECDIVVDVGGDYNPEKGRFDHHQKEFTETFSSLLPHLSDKNHIRLSSAGLIYVHYGMEVLLKILEKNDFYPDSDCLKKIFIAVYVGFVEELDAIDNGIPMFTESLPKYQIGTHLSARIHKLNPPWNSKVQTTNEIFYKAMDLAGSEFREKVIELATVWWPAREIVKRAIKTRLITHESGEIIELRESCPWKEHFLSLEEELGEKDELKFVIFQDSQDAWRVQAIPLQSGSFICRVFLHKDWRGLRDEKLSGLAGIKDCMFVHSTGFIGGNKTREGALQMAIRTLNAAKYDSDVGK